MNALKKLFLFIDGLLSKLEVFFIVFFFLLVLVLSFVQVVLRNISAELAISWFDQVERQFTLWIGLIGAAYAAGKVKHINIDVFSKYFEKYRVLIHSVLNIFSATFCIILTAASFNYMKLEYDLATEPLFTIELFNLKIFLWYFTVAIPAGYMFITLHFIINLFIGRTRDPDEKTAVENSAELTY
jgi:TRAP-type C4-dicarboxylate transport system permease small subunit